MADSDTTQQVTSKGVTTREAYKKLLLAEARAIKKRAETPSAEPAKNVLTKTQRQSIIIKAVIDLHSALPRDSFLEVYKAIAKHADFSCDEQSSANAE